VSPTSSWRQTSLARTLLLTEKRRASEARKPNPKRFIEVPPIRGRSWSLLYAPEASSVPRDERALIPSGVQRGLNNVRCPGSYLALLTPLGVVRSIDVGDVLFRERLRDPGPQGLGAAVECDGERAHDGDHPQLVEFVVVEKSRECGSWRFERRARVTSGTKSARRSGRF